MRAAVHGLEDVVEREPLATRLADRVRYGPVGAREDGDRDVEVGVPAGRGVP